MRRSDRAALLAFDIGTSSIKVLLVDAETGTPFHVARRPSSSVSATGLPVDLREQDADFWWRALCDATREALGVAERSGGVEVRGIGMVGHGPSLVPVLEDGSAAGPAHLWRDRRAADDEVALGALLGRSGWLLGELPKARWLLRERPDSAASASWLLSTWDAIAFRLSGTAVSSFWDPARSLSPADRNTLLGAGVDVRAMPPEVFPGTCIGTLLPRPAEELGLVGGIPIAAGVNDGLGAVIGAGLVRAGIGVDVGGTAGGVAVAEHSLKARQIVEQTGSRLWAGPAPLPFGDLMVLGGAFAGTGRILEWVIEDLLADSADAVPARRAALFEEAGALPLGAEGLMARPISQTGWRAQASASDAFVGITAAHRPAHFVRAAIEGGALAVAHLLTPALKAGLTLTEMRLSGPATGAAPGPLSHAERVPVALVQMRADLFGVPVVVGQNPEASAAGAAALAGVASGAFHGLREAAEQIAQSALRVEPQGNQLQHALELRARYSALMSDEGESLGGRRAD